MLTKISIFHAPSVHNTWAKEGILIHSGDTSHFFYRFKVFNRPVFGCRLVDDADDVITWGTGIGGAKSDYQTFERMETIEVDFEMFADELNMYLTILVKSVSTLMQVTHIHNRRLTLWT